MGWVRGPQGLRWVVGCLVAVLALGMAVGPVSAGHSWGNYHWARTSNPFTLLLGNNTSGSWQGHLGTASSDWSGSAVLDTSIVGGGTNPRQCRATSGRVEVCNFKYGRTGWLGVAQIWISGDHIVQGVAKMNDTYFNMSAYNSPAWRQFVMCQEVGHTFGLGHTDETHANPNQGTCMDYTNDPDGGPGGASETDLANTAPNGHDYEQLGIIYSHLDGTTTVGTEAARTAGLSDIVPPDPSGPERGGVSSYATELGGGNRVVTFIIWADANLIAAGHAAPQAPIADGTTAEEGFPADEGEHDHEAVVTDTDGDGSFAAGSTVVTTADVNLRATASRQGAIVQELPAGTVLTVTGPTETNQGLEWVPVTTEDGLLTGYVAADYLATP